MTMKNMKKVFALLLSVVMVMAMSVAVFAQSVSTGSGLASITISNASKGTTYKVSKLFGATVTGTNGGSVRYTGDVPTELSAYFETDGANVTLKSTVDFADPAVQAAFKTWAENHVTAEAESDGSTLTFTGLEYGYYIVTTSQAESAITVTTTNPSASVVDKNSTTPVTDLKKDADHTDINIGDTVIYTVSFGTANYTGAGENAKQITSYVIEDTLPGFLENVVVDNITIGGEAYTGNIAFDNKKITIPWVDAEGANLYDNGAEIVITYHATVADTAKIDGTGNKNTVTVTPYTGNDPDEGSKASTDETIYTYAIALKKVDQSGHDLAGAKFELPFYVKTATADDGSYIYAGTTAGEGLTNMVTSPADGVITIKGVKSGTYSIKEAEAPNGYNKLLDPILVTAKALNAEKITTTIYLDAKGNITDKETETSVSYQNNNFAATAVVVVNKTGAELPSTGGMGTTIFYVIGAVLVLGAGVLLVARRRMTAK